MTTELLIAGFGGQGVLFAGKCIAYKGLFEGRELSWLPSYGPEMRGGTANCSVVISADPIGSPLVQQPDVLLAMNKPSMEKFIDAVKPGGTILVDSTLIERKVKRDDVKVCYIPATKLAADMNAPTLANMVMMGQFIKVSGAVKMEGLEDAMKKVISAKHVDLLELNVKAINCGYDYEA